MALKKANTFLLLADECAASDFEISTSETIDSESIDSANAENNNLSAATISDEDMTGFTTLTTPKASLSPEAKAAKAALAEKEKQELIASGAAKKLVVPLTIEEQQHQNRVRRKAEHQARVKAAWEARRAAYFEQKEKAEAERKAALEAGRPAFLEREARRQQKAAREAAARERKERKQEEAALHERMTKASIFDYIKKI